MSEIRIMTNVQVGDHIVVKEHTRYKYIRRGALIDPAKPYTMNGYRTTVEDILDDGDGNPIIVTARGEMLRPDEVEIG